jgi:hypothetical protein
VELVLPDEILTIRLLNARHRAACRLPPGSSMAYERLLAVEPMPNTRREQPRRVTLVTGHGR